MLSGSSRTSKNKTLLRIEQWIPKLPAMTCANPVGKQLMLNCFASVTCTWPPWCFASMAAKTVANSVTGRKESLEGRWGKPPPELALAPDQSSYPQPQYQVAITARRGPRWGGEQLQPELNGSVRSLCYARCATRGWGKHATGARRQTR